jgi:hypothetical protein
MKKSLILGIGGLLLFTGCCCNQVNTNKKMILNTPKPIRSNVITIYATGTGVAPANAINAAHAKVMARRAAIIDAYRVLAEKMYGIKITAKERVKDFILRNSEVYTYVEGLIRGAVIQSEEYKDGVYYVSMSLKLDPQIWNKIITCGYGLCSCNGNCNY